MPSENAVPATGVLAGEPRLNAPKLAEGPGVNTTLFDGVVFVWSVVYPYSSLFRSETVLVPFDQLPTDPLLAETADVGSATPQTDASQPAAPRAPVRVGVPL